MVKILTMRFIYLYKAVIHINEISNMIC